MQQKSLITLAEVVVVGLPFSVFKMLTGVVALGGSFRVAGYLLLALGVLDLLLNLANMLSLVVVRRRVADVCVVDFIVRRLDRGAGTTSDLGIALDVFVSFGLVAIAIGCGLIAQMPRWALSVWNVAVVLNVLGAGFGRLFEALRQRRAAET